VKPLPLGALAALAVALSASPSPGGWGGGSCEPVRFAPSPMMLPPPMAPPPVVLAPPALPPAMALPGAAKAPGVRVLKTAAKRPGCGCSDTCECGEPCPCKGTGRLCDKNCRCVVASAELPTGVVAEKIRPGRRYSVNGKDVTARAAYAVVGADLTDDSGRDHLAVVGDQAFRDKVRGLLDARPEWASKLHVQLYAPDQWQVASRGLKPGLTLRSKDGAELSQAADVKDAEGLESFLKRVPPPQPLAPIGPGPAPLNVPLPAWVAGLLALLLLWKRTPNV
jgi:hypothetical protein